MRLLENGYHVVLDKPYCFTKEQAEHLQKAEEKSKKNIYFVDQNRFSGTSVFLKNRIDEQILGEIYLVQTNCFWSRNERYYTPNSWKGKKELDGGTLYTQFFHFVDLLNWLFGIQSIRNKDLQTFRHGNLIEIEDTGSVSFNLERSKAIAQLNFSTAVYQQNLESSMTIIAEKGTVKIAGQYFNEVVACNILDYEFDPKLIKTSSNEDNLISMYSAIVCDFPKKSTAAAESHFRTVEIIEEVYR